MKIEIDESRLSAGERRFLRDIMAKTSKHRSQSCPRDIGQSLSACLDPAQTATWRKGESHDEGSGKPAQGFTALRRKIDRVCGDLD